jgi:hypothetical protein
MASLPCRCLPRDVVWIKAPQGGILLSIQGYDLGRG